jgi:hypothetical protein
LPDGPTCDACPILDSSTAVSHTVVGPDGKFVLSDVPSGDGIPLVVQLGPWRMQTTIDVKPCVDNVLPDGKVRLPRNQQEGDIPLMAVATGKDDHLECLLRKLGIADSEFTNPSGNGRVHLYRGNGAVLDANTPDESVLKGSATAKGDFARYAQVLLPCHGAETLETADTLAHFADYVKSGGRVAAMHFSYVWLFQNGALGNIGTWTPGSPDPAAPLAADVPTAAQRSVDFAAWLNLVGALSRPSPPQVQIAVPHADLGLLASTNAELLLSSAMPTTTQGFVAAIPADPPDKACGRVAFADFHRPAASSQNTTFPTECDSDAALSTEEKALEFMLFDSFACKPSVKGPPLPVMPPLLPPPAPPPPPSSPPPPN